ncbi:unnamed protein product [Lathyrus sativus]|nr:unnamed protein product [Lathyrus sativus]
MTTVTTVSYRFNINGQYTDRINTRRGIRQGDPLSPLLFVIIMEYFSRLLLKMQRNPEFNHHAKCERLQITHLTFADDLLLFSRGDHVSVEILYSTLNKFLYSTGLKINPSKSRVYFGNVPASVKCGILHLTSYKEGSFPFRYLGIQLTSKRLAVIHYMPLLDRLLSRITHWSSRLLSYAGRLQLIKSVLYAITTYWMQCIWFPKTVINKINAICRSFLWSGGNNISRKSPVAWENVCKPHVQGGLNVMNLEVWNNMFVIKLLWNIYAKSDDLWVRWIHAYYLRHEDILTRMVKGSDSGIFKAILIQRDKLMTIQSTWDAMLQMGKFHGRKVYQSLLPITPNVPWAKLILHNRARPRAIITLWTICHGKLATKSRLFRFGMINNNKCAFCNEEETIDHLFFCCVELKQIWSGILKWLGIQLTPKRWQEEMQWALSNYGGKGWQSDLVRLALTETLHEIWLYRNEACFNHRTDNRNCLDRIIYNIMYRGWTSPKLRPRIARFILPRITFLISKST